MKPFFLFRKICGIYFSCIFCASCFLSCSTFYAPFELSARERDISERYYDIASSYESLKNYEKASKYYNIALEKASKDDRKQILYKIARCEALLEHWDSSLSIYNDLLKDDSDNLSLKVSLSYIYAMKGDLETSEKMYRELEIQNPHDEKILKNYILVLIARDKKDDAKLKFEELKEKFPDCDAIKTIEENLTSEKPLEEQKVE